MLDNTDNRSRTSLGYSLEAQAAFSAGEPIVVRFTLNNESDERLWALKWSTPLEGICGVVFSVARDGRELSYRGPTIKRGDPDAGDYVQLDPGGSVSAAVDLSRAYDLATPGQVRVEFHGRIHDLIRAPESPPRPRKSHVGMEPVGNSVELRIVPR